MRYLISSVRSVVCLDESLHSARDHLELVVSVTSTSWPYYCSSVQSVFSLVLVVGLTNWYYWIIRN